MGLSIFIVYGVNGSVSHDGMKYKKNQKQNELKNSFSTKMKLLHEIKKVDLVFFFHLNNFG